MEDRKGQYSVVMSVVVVILGGLVIHDIYDDWFVRDYSLASTLIENSIPLLFVFGLAYATYWVRRDGTQTHSTEMARWTVTSLAGLLLIAGWVTALQLLEQEVQPLVVLTHAAIGGAIAGTVIGYNVAERKETQAEIETEKHRFEALFENSPAAMVDLRYEDGNTSIHRSNSAFEAMFGHASADVEGKDLFEVVSLADDAVESSVGEHVDSETVYQTDVTLESEQGEHYTLRVIPYDVGTEGNRAFALYTDVTEIRETKRELEETVEQLEDSNDRLQQFAYIASHDLQEPARMVSSYAQLLEEEYGDELDDEAREYMDFVTDGAKRMQQMIDGLLEYSRIRTQAEEFDSVDIESILDAVQQDLSLRIEESGTTLTTDPLPTVEGDRQQLRQVFQNLIENGIDHGGESPDIHVGCDEREDSYVFSIIDDGPGIEQIHQDKVFELFKRGSRDGEGTGLGLAICDRIVARHGGDIWVVSEDSEGTTFYFSIPK